MKKTLLIGGSGFIGSHLHEVYPQEKLINLDLVSPAFTYRSTYVQGDIRSYADLEGTLKRYSDCDTIINLAAEHQDFGISREEYMLTNVHGTEQMCKAATNFGIKKIVFYSSVAVYGNNEVPSSERMKPNPANDYGDSKLMAEQVLKEWAAADSERQVLIMRPVVVYGERNVANMYRLIQQIQKGRYFHIGKAENIKSIAYVRNIVEATLFLMNRMQSGVAIYNYADEPQMSIRETADTIVKALGRKPLISLPYGLLYFLALPFDLIIKMTGKNLPISTNRIRKLCTQTYHKAEKIQSTGFIPPYSNREGLSNMVYWMETGKIKELTARAELVS